MQLSDAYNKIVMAAFDVLYKDWYRTVPVPYLIPGSDMYKQLISALKKAGLVYIIDGLQTMHLQAAFSLFAMYGCLPVFLFLRVRSVRWFGELL